MSVAYEIPSFFVGVLAAGSDFSSEAADQFVAMDVGAGETAVLPLAGAPVLGICQHNPVAGEAVQIMVAGVSKAKIAGTVAAGDLLMTNSAGKLLLATTGNHAIAKAMQAGVSGDVVAVLLKSYGKV